MHKFWDDLKAIKMIVVDMTPDKTESSDSNRPCFAELANQVQKSQSRIFFYMNKKFSRYK